MSLIDKTYFKGLINIPSNAYNDAAILDAISYYEVEFLKTMLGYTAWNEFNTAYLASIAQTPTALPEKWAKLKDGAEFSFDYYGKTVNTKWNGLVNTEKVSPIANYIFYQFRRNGILSNTGGVDFYPSGDAPQAIDPYSTMIEVWNTMVDMYGQTPIDCLRYDLFPSDLANYIHYNKMGSAYNFLLANRDIYTTWEFEPIYKLTFL